MKGRGIMRIWFPTGNVSDSNGNPVTKEQLKSLGFHLYNDDRAILPTGWTIASKKQIEALKFSKDVIDHNGIIRGQIYEIIDRSGQLVTGSAVLYCRLRFFEKSKNQTRDIWVEDRKTGEKFFIFTCEHDDCVFNDFDRDFFFIKNPEFKCFSNKLKQIYELRDGWDDPTKYWDPKSNFVFKKK